MSDLKTNVLGYPRVGEKRELKVAVESYWKGNLSAEGLDEVAQGLRRKAWMKMREAGIDLIPSNDFSYYDQVLDMSCLLGNLPRRFGKVEGDVSLDTLFAVARGSDDQAAAEMTKWFNTNYHYIVPEFDQETEFRLASQKVFEEYKEAKALGIQTKPVLIGPVTYLSLGKGQGEDFDRYELLGRLLPVYAEILEGLATEGAEWVQMDEPVLSLDLSADEKIHLYESYRYLSAAVPELKLIVSTYFGPLRDNLETLMSLPVAAYHVDAVAGAEEVSQVIAAVPEGKVLSLGVVEGRNIWKNDYRKSLALTREARDVLGQERFMVSTSCSLLHSPYSLEFETELDEELKGWLAFADEKLDELSFLRDFVLWKAPVEGLEENTLLHRQRTESERIHNPVVKSQVDILLAKDLERDSVFSIRQQAQRAKNPLPLFPTTTIGSFPQTKEVRQARARWRRGDLGEAEYDGFVKSEIEDCIRFQEDAGLDLLVHGEFERTDMVEFFGEKLEGFAFTLNGWVQSYGSRCVKPPVIYADVSRPEPMTVGYAAYAQSLTERPVKGMLTGPITILQWSFVRDDQERSLTAKQIALAIRAEVRDLEEAGLAAIQIDEPALREGLPLRQSDHGGYLRWAVDAFRLSAASVRDETQIHTHMCYCEFNDVIDSIAELDADVITIETSRSNMELLGAFSEFHYPNEIGPGVYDIHSPRLPSREEMKDLLVNAAAVIPAKNLWVNPDCGLKTRTWDEVKPALTEMVAAAQEMRELQVKSRH